QREQQGGDADEDDEQRQRQPAQAARASVAGRGLPVFGARRRIALPIGLVPLGLTPARERGVRRSVGLASGLALPPSPAERAHEFLPSERRSLTKTIEPPCTLQGGSTRSAGRQQHSYRSC